MSKVLYEVRDDIAYITLNRPEVHNAIDGETDESLFQAWSSFATNPAARLAILTGAGDTTFCAGADLKSHVEPWLSAGPNWDAACSTRDSRGVSPADCTGPPNRSSRRSTAG